MAAYLVVVVGVPLAIAIASLFVGRRRWGAERVPVQAGAGAYREGSVTRVVPRDVPARVVVAALAAQVWGGVTLFVLVPAGGMLALMSGGAALDGRESPVWLLFAMVVIAAVVSGAIHASALFVTGASLAKREREATPRARLAARHGRWHHALVWALFPLPLLLDDATAWGFGAAMLALPCGLGFLVAEAIARAGAAVDALDARDLVDQERISTESPTAISTIS